MGTRLNYGKAAPGAMRAMGAVENYLDECGLEPALIDLIKLRASQINGCAYCVDMHSLDLRAEGETEQRIYALPVWGETPFFTERERAALLWTEKLTLIAVDHVPDLSLPSLLTDHTIGASGTRGSIFKSCPISFERALFRSCSTPTYT